jgi:hypothetical protein
MLTPIGTTSMTAPDSHIRATVQCSQQIVPKQLNQSHNYQMPLIQFLSKSNPIRMKSSNEIIESDLQNAKNDIVTTSTVHGIMV